MKRTRRKMMVRKKRTRRVADSQDAAEDLKGRERDEDGR